MVTRKSLNEQEGFYTLQPPSICLNNDEGEYIPTGEWFPPSLRNHLYILMSFLSVCGVDLIRKFLHFVAVSTFNVILLFICYVEVM